MSGLIFEFEAPKGQRVRRYGWAVTTLCPDGEESLWWAPALRRWVTDAERKASYTDEATALDCSSHCRSVRTLKAFKRHVRRHAETLAGRTVIWVNRFEGLSVSVAVPSLGDDASEAGR